MGKKRRKKRQVQPVKINRRKRIPASELRATKQLAITISKATAVYLAVLVAYIVIKSQQQRYVHISLHFVLLGITMLVFCIILWISWLRGRRK